MVAAPVAATPGAGAAPAAGGAAAPAEVKKEEKKEKKTANVKLVKYDAKDKTRWEQRGGYTVDHQGGARSAWSRSEGE